MRLKALSIRPYWAWLIINGSKDVENRDWITHFRGRFLIHASGTLVRDEYAFAHTIAAEQGIDLPPMKDLPKSGIIGEANLVDCVDIDPSPWFFGDYGFVLKDRKPLPFIPLSGRLNFFEVPADLLKQ